MGAVQRITPVKLIVGLISKDEALFYKVADVLQKQFGAIDYKSNVYDFDYTDYYKKELGENLKRIFFSFKKLVMPDTINVIKLYTNRIEKTLGSPGLRKVNIDPGYLDLAKLVLATTKDFSHRIYLGKGIYAEVTLIYKNGCFQPLDWTYPDYRTQNYITTFNKIRDIYHRQANEYN
jgi:hypothetical protein